MNPPGLFGGNLERVSVVANRRAAGWLGLALIVLLSAFAAMHPIRDPDFGWHLALGRYIAEHHSVPTTEPFTHTAFGAPMVAHEWLSQLLLYGGAKTGGILGLRLLHATAVALLLAGFFAMARRAGSPPAIALLTVLAYALIARSRLELRPQMFNLAATMALYQFVFLSRPSLRPRQLLAIGAAVALWTNLHAGAVLFPVLVSIYLGVEVVTQRSGWRPPRPDDLGGGSLLRLGALAATSFVAVLCTPYHVRLLPYLLETGRVNRGLSAEWSSIMDFWGDPLNFPLELETLAMAGVCVVAAAVFRARRDAPSQIAVVLFLALLPLVGQRFVDLYFAPLLFAATALSQWLRNVELGPVRRQLTIVLSTLCVAVIAPWAIGSQLVGQPLEVWLSRQGNFQPVSFPSGAVSFLEQVQLEGQLFNIERWGGYLLLRTYQQYPIFIDGRWVTIGREVARDALAIERRLEGTFEKLDAYGVDILLLPRGWMTQEIARERGWVAAFENFNAGVYLRAGAGADLARCRDYYAARNIPVDPEVGFEGREAQRANPEWASRLRVEPRYVDHFRLWGNPIGVSPRRVVNRW